MDRDELKAENEKLLARRQELQAKQPDPSPLDQAKLNKCATNSKPILAEAETVIASTAWPPPSLAPARLGSNLEKWESFDWDRHPKLRPAKRILVDWYNGLPNSGALVLAGDVGCGKTHLVNALADLYGRWRISYYEEVELVKKIQATYDDKTQSEESIIRALFRSDLFILDDLGTYTTKNEAWLSNLYNRIFNDYMTVREKPVLITTNLQMLVEDDKADVVVAGLEARIGARSFSRLCDALDGIQTGRYVDLFGVPDFRIERFLGKGAL